MRGYRFDAADSPAPGTCCYGWCGGGRNRGDARRVLRLALRAWRVGIVSNGMADNQLAKIERSGVGERVDACCVSGEVGIRKPYVPSPSWPPNGAGRIWLPADG